MIIDPFRFSGPFDPLTSLDGTLAFWGKQSYDITSSPDIDTWNDESGNNNDPTQGTAADKPHDEADVINGFSVAEFDGAGDFLDANQTFQTEGRDQLGYGFVCRIVDGQPTSTSILTGARNAGNTERCIHFLFSTAGQINVSFEVDNNIFSHSFDLGFLIHHPILLH